MHSITSFRRYRQKQVSSKCFTWFCKSRMLSINVSFWRFKHSFCFSKHSILLFALSICTKFTSVLLRLRKRVNKSHVNYTLKFELISFLRIASSFSCAVWRNCWICPVSSFTLTTYRPLLSFGTDLIGELITNFRTGLSTTRSLRPLWAFNFTLKSSSCWAKMSIMLI